MSQVKDSYLILRVDAQEKQDYEKLAKEVYGFKNASDFIRYALDYVAEKRPTLGGKGFAPGNANG